MALDPRFDPLFTLDDVCKVNFRRLIGKISSDNVVVELPPEKNIPS